MSVCLRGRVGGCEGGGVRGAGGEKREVPRGVMDRLRLAIWASAGLVRPGLGWDGVS